VQFDVVVEDKGTEPLRDVVPIRITINDVNDEAPTFSMPVYSTRLFENSQALQLSLRYTDEDNLLPNTESNFTIMSVSPQG
jgi:hypothetical protein